MVVCKYFLQGTCKFGDICKFEHDVNDGFRNFQNKTSNSVMQQANFGSTPQQQMQPTNPSHVDTSTLVKSVVNDMTFIEKGGQWLLSCYAPFKEKPAFPGFEDYSFEEIRFGYYDAVKNRTLDQYKQYFIGLLQQAILKVKSLQAPSPDIVNVLKNIYNMSPSFQAGVYGINNPVNNAFGNGANLGSTYVQQQSSNLRQGTSSVFPQSNQNVFGIPAPSQSNIKTSSNVFGSTSQNTSIFGGTNNSPFVSNQNQTQSGKTIFGQATGQFTSPTNTSIFSGQISGPREKIGTFFNNSSSNSIFGGGTTANTNIFATNQSSSPFTAQPQGTSNVFANTTTSIFNQNTSFVSPNNINTFGQSPMASNSVFGQNPPQPASTGIFAPAINQSQNRVFGSLPKPIFPTQQPQNLNSPLSTLLKNTADTQHSASIFGNNQQVGNSSPQFSSHQNDVALEGVYSKLEDLTEDEISWFESDDLDILKIPEKPPTFEMCFKT